MYPLLSTFSASQTSFSHRGCPLTVEKCFVQTTTEHISIFIFSFMGQVLLLVMLSKVVPWCQNKTWVYSDSAYGSLYLKGVLFTLTST